MLNLLHSSNNLDHLPVIRQLNLLKAQLGLRAGPPNTTQRQRLSPYALTSNQISTPLRLQLDDLMDSLTDEFFYPSNANSGPGLETAIMRLNHVYRILGAMHHYLGLPWETFTLESLVVFRPIKTALRQTTSYADVKQIEHEADEAAEQTLELARQCLRALRKHRQIGPGTEVLILEAWISVAKFLYRKETNIVRFKNFEDIPVISLLRQEFNGLKPKAEKAAEMVDYSKKWLDWPDFLRFVQQLERECHQKYKGGSKRSDTATAVSYQRYLIASLLAYLPPDRQRTLRELEQGKTLVKGHLRQVGKKVWIEESDQGLWYIRLGKGDYKTSESYGEQFHLIPDLLYPYLEAWLSRWRAVLNPQHSFVFTQKNGKPYKTAGSFLSVFKRAAYRITGQATTPHLVRHMIITYLKRQGASDAVMKSLAAAMHHSDKAQSEYYDERSLYEQGLCAQEVVLKLATGQSVANVLQTYLATPEDILQAVEQLAPDARRQLIRKLQETFGN